MTPLVKGKANQAWPVVFWCIMAIVIFVMILAFSLREPGAEVSQAEAPVHNSFSSPSSEVGVDSSAPAFFMSTLDLQRELNRRYPKLKLKVDGVYGPATKAAHERACGDQYAIELMVREAK